MKTVVRSCVLFGLIACGPMDLEAPVPDTPSTHELIVPGASSTEFAGPGGTYFKGAPHISFIGTDGRVNVVRRLPAGNWAAPVVLPDRGPRGASLVSHLSQLFVAYYGDNANFTTQKSIDSVNFEERREVRVLDDPNKEVLIGAPALVVYGNVVNAFVAIGPANGTTDEWNQRGRIRHFVREADTQWHDYGTLSATAGATPSAAVLGDKLVLAYTHHGLSFFFTRIFTPGDRWTDPIKISKSQSGDLFPAISSDGSPLLLWLYREKGSTGTDSIGLAKTTDGSTFTFIKNLNHTSARRPAGIFASMFDNRIEWTHTGTDPFHSVNFNTDSF
jgi:hypothetical protein